MTQKPKKESKRELTETEPLSDEKFFESLDRVNRIMQGSTDIERTMSDVLDVVLSIFGCDRTFLAVPCDPDEPEFNIPMERTSPAYPGAFEKESTVPMSPAVKNLFKVLLSSPGPHEIYIGKGLDPEDEVWKIYEVKSQLAIALYPKVGKPWEFGMHQCSHARVWTPQEKKLFQEISRRFADGLTSLLLYRDLQKSEAFLNKIVEHIPNMIFVKDAESLSYVRLNKAGEQLLGYSREELIGKKNRDIFPKEKADIFTAQDREVFKTGALVDIPEETITNRNHEERILHTQKIPIPDETGKPGYLLGIAEDITARKRTEEELKIQKQRFQALSESSPMGMAVIDANSSLTFKYMNPKFKELFGCDITEVPDIASWLIRVYPDPARRRKAQSIWADMLNAVTPGITRSYVKKLGGKTGAHRSIKVVPVQLQADEILLTCWDITKNKEAVRRIRERNLVLGVLNDIMASVSRSLELSEILEPLRIVLVEKLKISAGGIFFSREGDSKIKSEQSWGVPALLQKDFDAIALRCPHDGQVLYKNDIVLVRNNPNGAETEEGAKLKGAGLRSWLCISLCAKGEMQGMIFLADRKSDTFSDDQIAVYKTLGQQVGVAIQNARLFEEVRRSDVERKALSLRLVRAQEDELRFLARELHDEIGQLLTGLRLAIEMAMQSAAEPIASLGEAKSIAHTLTGLVRELSRKLRPSMLDDLGLFPTLRWLFERVSTQTNIQVVFEHTQSDTRRFSHDVETAVYRIAQEALTNVARHARVNRATVRLWSNEKTIGIQIEDQGVGFDFANVSRYGNTNGLNVMRERVVLLGGRFTVEAAPDAGARLTAELPLEMEVEQL